MSLENPNKHWITENHPDIYCVKVGLTYFPQRNIPRLGTNSQNAPVSRQSRIGSIWWRSWRPCNHKRWQKLTSRCILLWYDKRKCFIFSIRRKCFSKVWWTTLTICHKSSCPAFIIFLKNIVYMKCYTSVSDLGLGTNSASFEASESSSHSS